MSKYESSKVRTRSRRASKGRRPFHPFLVSPKGQASAGRTPLSRRVFKQTIKAAQRAGSLLFRLRNSSIQPATVAAASRALSSTGGRASAGPFLIRAFARRFRSASLMTLIRGLVFVKDGAATPASTAIPRLTAGCSGQEASEEVA